MDVVWWMWLLLWVVLALGAAAVLGLLAWGLVKQGLALVTDAGTAAGRAGDLLAQVESLPAPARPRPAIFDEPTRLRRERMDRLKRDRRSRARLVAARRRTT